MPKSNLKKKTSPTFGITNVSPIRGYDNRTKPFYQVNNFDDKYTARFSNLFQPFGHNYTPTFDVLKIAYWRKHQILTWFDCAVYDTVHLYCKTKTPFSLKKLAKEMGVGDDKLKLALDNLENAELLEVILITDEYGRHNCYLLKTPYFERESIQVSAGKSKAQRDAAQRKQGLFDKFDKSLPTVFLEDVLPRLRENVEKNKVKQLRDFFTDHANETEEKLKNNPLYLEASARQNRAPLFKQVTRTFEEHAADFDEQIYKWTPELAQERTDAGVWSKLREKIKRWCKSLNFKYDDEYHPSIGRKLYRFFAYLMGLKLQSTETTAPLSSSDEFTGQEPEEPETPSNVVPIATGRDRADSAEAKIGERNRFRQILTEKRERRTLPDTFGDWKRFLFELGFKALTQDDQLKVIEEFLTEDKFKKLKVVLKQ